MARASKGRGTVVHRPERRRFVAALVVDGVKHQRTATYQGPRDMGNAKRRAEAALDEMRERYLGTGPRADEPLGAFLERWLAFAEPTLRNPTFVSYCGVVRNHIVPFIGRRPLSDLTVADIDTWLVTLGKEGRSPQIRQRARKILGRAFAQAMAWGLVATNPVRSSTAPSIPNIERETLSPTQAMAFLDAVAGERLEAAFLLGAVLGLRSGEVRGLRWSDIGEDTIRVERGLVYERLADGSHAYALRDTKTPRSRRTVPLPDFVREALERRREGQRFEAQTPGWHNPWDLVFTGRWTGEPISAFGLMTRTKTILERAGLPVVPFHALRHAAASLMLARGVPLRVAQDLLGHATPTMTLSVYGHSDDEQRRQVAASLESWRRS